MTPFEHNHADPWARSFVDLTTLNARVTDAIAEMIAGVCLRARNVQAELRTENVLVLGPAGAGKTHLFARLRRKLGPRAVFVHLRPLVGTEMTPRYVLGEIVKQLAYDTVSPDGESYRQLETLLGSSLAFLRGESTNMPRAFLEALKEMPDDKRRDLLESAVCDFVDAHPEVDEAYLARLLTTPFMKTATQRAALAWLAGRDLEESQLARLGVPTGLAEERIIGALQTLGRFAAAGAPIVLVFDQLENLVDAEGLGSRVRAYANLVAELFDTMRGFVLVQMALDSEWEKAILPELSEAQKTRLQSRSELIALPRPDEAEALVRVWVEQLPEPREPFPWPFGARRVRLWRETPGMTPRMLMIACRHALAEGDAAEEPAESVDESAIPDGLAQAWEDHLAKARAALDEAAADRRAADAARLIGGVACALRFVTGVKVQRIDARQTMQIETKAGDTSASLCFLHQTHPRAVTSALVKVGEARKKGTVLAVRERVLEFPPTWKVVQGKQATLVSEGVRWITLERDDAAKLLALESFVAAARSRDLEDGRGQVVEEAEVMKWIASNLDIPSWTIARAFMTGEFLDEAPTETMDVLPERPISETAATIQACLSFLRVASLDRLVRDVVRIRPEATRTEIVALLRTMDVRWFGHSVISVKAS